jgi:hypothetical protein
MNGTGGGIVTQGPLKTKLNFISVFHAAQCITVSAWHRSEWLGLSPATSSGIKDNHLLS